MIRSKKSIPYVSPKLNAESRPAAWLPADLAVADLRFLFLFLCRKPSQKVIKMSSLKFSIYFACSKCLRCNGGG